MNDSGQLPIELNNQIDDKMSTRFMNMRRRLLVLLSPIRSGKAGSRAAASKRNVYYITQIAIVLAFLLCPGSATAAVAAGGACPSNTPVTGNNCFFVAANGSDTNNGTSESTPWQHAPGMPNCSGACAAVQTSFGGGGNDIGGYGIIFRGGDTWHAGNPGAVPYIGGTWTWNWSGHQPTCSYEGTMTGCNYLGVDKAWFNSSYCGASWCRPIISGDNPPSLSLVASCAYYPIGATNTLLSLSGNVLIYVDSFELTGLCSNDTTQSHMGNAGFDNYILNNGIQWSLEMQIFNNLYFHNFTQTTAANQAEDTLCSPDCIMGGVFAGGGHSAYLGIVEDFSDSMPGSVANGFLNIYHMKNSMFRYIADITAATCHDIHDNIFEHYYNPTTPKVTHANMLECNGDLVTNTANTFYNNIMRHFDPGWSTAGQVGLWFCPNTTPEYWFNNVQYDMVASNGTMWSVVGPPIYSGCSNTGKQYMFNNTIVDSRFDCAGSNDNTQGQYMYMYNNHFIGSGGINGSTCNGYGSSTNVTMTNTVATLQGYTTGSSGTAGTGNNCANDATPCAATSSTASTVAVAGSNFMPYCTALASYTSEYAIGTEAANACKYGTTDACAYNSATHTMNCPAMVAIARPISAAWNIGASQFSSSAPLPPPPQAPLPPTSLSAVVH